MAATATASSMGLRYAPPDPTLPKPWKGLVDDKTGYLYFLNPETNVTHYERPSSSAAPPKSSSVPSSSVQVQHMCQGSQRGHSHDFSDRYDRNGSGGSNEAGTRNNQAADSIAYSSTPPVVFICGAKNCGKTTFSRYLLNILLHKYTKVAYLDTDVGQPEFTPPAFLSLTVVHKVTPDLTVPCLKTPERCLFFGVVSSKRDPSTYLSYVFAIYDYYQKEYCISEKGENPCNVKLPLIVNTSGWVKGVGYDVLVDMLKYISPTHVVKINISSENKNLPAGKFWLDEECDGTINLIEINLACQDSSNRSVLFQKDARPLRDLRLMAYFRQCFSCDSNISTIKELAHALASHCPYEVPIASVNIRHLHCEVPSSEMFFSLNATIVGLAVDSEGPENLPWCVGLGIVRGIDTVKGVLYVITPVPHSSLEKVNLLLQGYIQIPSCLLQVQGCISPYMSANTLAIN